MNAVIALTHFCELHGPSIVFCTQAFHAQDPIDILDASTSQPDFNVNQRNIDETVSQHSGDIIFYGSIEPWLRSKSSSSVPSTPGSGNLGAGLSTAGGNVSEMCEACKSMPTGQPGFISNDHEAKISYISSQYPCHPEIFSIVRQACVRSLSCEVCPGREGPIFFGDDQRGHVLSHTFFVKDSHARGFQRWYSILVVMMDKIFLLNSWPFLVKHIRIIIDIIQEKALKVYEMEQTECPQRSLRLGSGTNPRDFLRHRGMNKPARSLVELTQEKDLFQRFHFWFTWLLKAGGNRMSERLLEGPPTEDTVIDMERQEETEEGFVKLFTKNLEVTKKSDASCDSTLQSQTYVSVLSQETDSYSIGPTFKNLRHLLRVLEYEKFHLLCHHAIIGNQVIVRGSNRQLVESVIQALESLLPKGCCRKIVWSSVYEDSWKCNFLGLESGGVIPTHVLEDEKCIVLNIIPPETSNLDGGEDRQTFSGYMFDIEGKSLLTDTAPSLLGKMEQAMGQQKFTDEVFECALTTMKEEWMNKVKVLFKFSRASGSHSVEETKKLLRVLGATESDEPLLKFWMTGLSIQYKSHALEGSFNCSCDSYYEI